MKVITLTVDSPDTSTIVTAVFTTYDEVYESLRENHLDGYEDIPEDDAALVDFAVNAGYAIYIDEHEVSL